MYSRSNPHAPSSSDVSAGVGERQSSSSLSNISDLCSSGQVARSSERPVSAAVPGVAPPSGAIGSPHRAAAVATAVAIVATGLTSALSSHKLASVLALSAHPADAVACAEAAVRPPFGVARSSSAARSDASSSCGTEAPLDVSASTAYANRPNSRLTTSRCIASTERGGGGGSSARASAEVKKPLSATVRLPPPLKRPVVIVGVSRLTSRMSRDRRLMSEPSAESTMLSYIASLESA